MKLVFETDKLKEKALSESGFLFDPSTGFTYTLNPSGVSIFRMLQQGFLKEEILTRVAQEFAIPEKSEVDQDYDDFIFRLRQVGLLVARQIEEE